MSLPGTGGLEPDDLQKVPSNPKCLMIQYGSQAAPQHRKEPGGFPASLTHRVPHSAPESQAMSLTIAQIKLYVMLLGAGVPPATAALVAW